MVRATVIAKLLNAIFFIVMGCGAVMVPSVASAAANVAKVQSVRVWNGPDTTRLIFDVSGAARYKIFRLDNPSRIVIDLSNVRLAKTFRSAVDLRDTAISQIRTGRRDASDRDLRIVLDVSKALKYTSALLPPYGEHGYRLVVDLDGGNSEITRTVATPTSVTPIQTPPDTKVSTITESLSVIEPEKTLPSALIATREIVIAIDAGHGGEDPGAIGPSGTREKDVALALARKLAELFRAQPGMRPVLIREGDYYLGLRQRIKKARQQKADLFVSIHADAHHNPRASGSSVFALSQRGASNEAARWLAERENAADLIGGVSLDDKDNGLASVLLDLSQTATIDASLGVGNRVLDGLKRIGNVHKRRVEQAGFMVLKSPDIPSILVETAFISNPEEESKLLDSDYQLALAQAIVKGVVAHFNDNPPPGIAVAAQQRRHTISRGDTLGTIARRYRISAESLRVANGLRTDQVNVGQVLRIPVEGI